MAKKLTDLDLFVGTPSAADLLYLVDVSDPTDDPDGSSFKITVSDLLAGVTVSDASTTVKGIVELATNAETITGTDTERAVTPAALQSKVSSETALGIVELATNAETITGTDSTRAVTPANITAKIDTDVTLAGNSDTRIASQKATKSYVDTAVAGAGGGSGMNNLIKNGNFINNSTNGYGGTPDDWTSSNAKPVQGGYPSFNLQQTIDTLGVASGDIEGLWPCNGLVNTDDIDDLSTNGYDLDTAGHVPDLSSDGLMGTALDFEATNTDYGFIALSTATALNITTSQTYFAIVKPESIGSDQWIIGLRGTSGPERDFYISSAGKAGFALSGLSVGIESDVVLQIGKRYIIVAIYNSSANTLTLWVNGIKKSVVVTGSPSALTNTPHFAIGRLGNSSSGYFDGLIETAGFLSVILSDDQVKRLIAATLYKGIKIRRATTNSLLTQSLPQNLVESLRGKSVCITARVYQEVASTAQVSINDGSETSSTTTATIGSWVNIGITKTISSTATSITLALKHSTTDGNSWFKEVLFYEGSSLVYTWYPSYDDINRFSRLMALDPPPVISGYQYEENKWLTMPTVSYGAGGSMTYTSVTTNFGKFMTIGQMGVLDIKATGTTGGSVSNEIYFTSPYCASALVNSQSGTAQVVDSGSVLAGYSYIDNSVSPARHYCRKYDASNFSTGAGRELRMTAIPIEIT